jgi:hypothetical protein
MNQIAVSALNRRDGRVDAAEIDHRRPHLVEAAVSVAGQVDVV